MRNLLVSKAAPASDERSLEERHRDRIRRVKEAKKNPVETYSVKEGSAVFFRERPAR